MYCANTPVRRQLAASMYGLRAAEELRRPHWPIVQSLRRSFAHDRGAVPCQCRESLHTAGEVIPASASYRVWAALASSWHSLQYS